MKLTATKSSAFHNLPIVESFAAHDGDCVVQLCDSMTIPAVHPRFVIRSERLSRAVRDVLDATKWRLFPLYVCRLNNARVFNQSDVVTADGRFLVDISSEWGFAESSHLAQSKKEESVEFEGRDEGRITEPTAQLFWHAACGFHHSHWLYQTLPKLDVFDRVRAPVKRFAVHPTIQTYQRETLSALGVASDSLLYRDVDGSVTYDELYVCSTWMHLPQRNSTYKGLAERFSPVTQGPQKLYITRSDSPKARRLLNEDAIIEVAKGHGYQIVTLSSLSLAEEIGVFKNPRYVVGPLGAGLYNCVFSEPGVKILALASSCYFLPHPLQLSAFYDHEFSIVFGETIISYEDKHNWGNHSSWVLDPAAFEAALTKLEG